MVQVLYASRPLAVWASVFRGRAGKQGGSERDVKVRRRSSSRFGWNQAQTDSSNDQNESDKKNKDKVLASNPYINIYLPGIQ